MKKKIILVTGLIAVICIILFGFSILTSIDIKTIVGQVNADSQISDNYSGILWTVASFVIVLAIVTNIVCLPYLIKEMAKNDFIFTLIDEGTAKAIMGANDSGFQHFIYQFKDFTLK